MVEHINGTTSPLLEGGVILEFEYEGDATLTKSSSGAQWYSVEPTELRRLKAIEKAARQVLLDGRKVAQGAGMVSDLHQFRNSLATLRLATGEK